MIHTLLLSAHIADEKVFEELHERLRLDTSIWNNTNRNYSSNGFREIRLINVQKRTGGTHKSLEIKLNPKLMLNPDCIIQSTTADEIPYLTKLFDHYIQNIFGDLILHLPQTFLDWTCSRIDYCVDVTTDHVGDYIKLFQRCKKPNRHFSNKRYSGSVYMNCKSTILNFYDKQDETEKRLDEEYTTVRVKHIEEAKNIIRFEIQCKKNKTNYIRRKYGFTDKRLEYFMDT